MDSTLETLTIHLMKKTLSIIGLLIACLTATLVYAKWDINRAGEEARAKAERPDPLRLISAIESASHGAAIAKKNADSGQPSGAVEYDRALDELDGAIADARKAGIQDHRIDSAKARGTENARR